jgi:hypothetical protein
VWRADPTPEHHDDGDVTERAATASSARPAPPVNAVEQTWSEWRAELVSLGGRSPLVHFDDTARSRIELSTTHPGGLAQFITGKNTLLSNLIRDDLALRTAKVAAGLIAAKGLELATTRGLDAVNLGIGIAEWQHDGVAYCAPILLRPLAIRRHGRDFELKLRGSAYLNPELQSSLAAQFGLELDPWGFAALAQDDGSFKPNQVIDRLRGLTSHLEWFNVQPRLVVSTFADVATSMLGDASDLEHPLLDALAGNTSAQWSVKEAYRPVEAESADVRSPQTDVLLLDADAEQENVIAQIAAGNSLVVKTLPGTGGTQTVVNAIGGLVAQNKRVLVVSARRGSLEGVVQRLGDIGLPGAAVAPRSLRRDLVRAISRNERAKQPNVAEVDDALVRLRTVLLDYRGALAKADPVIGVSVLDCVTELSRLALLPHPPRTSARLSRRAVEALTADRAAAAQIMITAAKLGEFRYGPGDSPWYGARFRSSEDALRAHRLAKRLWGESVPTLIERANEVIGTTRMRPFSTIRELGVYLRLLADLRDTLDRFVPAVFDRSISELIVATSSKRDSPDMSSANRRRLKKLAREYVRPGVHVGDMNEALVRIHKQRSLWQRYVTEGVPPEVPVGIADLQVAYQQVEQDLEALDEPLGHGPQDAFADLPIAQLMSLLHGLQEDSDVLDNLQERSTLMARLGELEVEPLTTDLAIRHVPEHEVAAELELAWWTSALDSLLARERALLGANTDVLDRLEADFRLVDEAHAAGSAGLLGWQLAETWKIGLVDWKDEAELLKQLLRRNAVSAFDLQTTAPHLSRSIAPVWVASPYEVPTIPDSMHFDAVLLLDAGATTVAETIPAIRRARQVVAFGDPITQTPRAFTIAITDADAVTLDEEQLADLHEQSALARLSSLLPTLALTRSYRPGGEDLAELVNRRFYGGRIESLPWAGTFLGHPSISLEYVPDGTGMPDSYTGAVESVDAEVTRVVDMVMAHALTRPRESLMVITASPLHAVRVQQAVLTAVAQRSDVSDFIIGDRPEPFTVLPIDQAVAESRDRVIFSIGFGRTPHGKVLSNFGVLSEPGGERLLAVAMTRARRSMSIVSCFTPEDVDDERMSHGAVALAEILGEVNARLTDVPLPDDGDPMLVDLARRLEQRGLRVALGHRGKLGLVASHGGMCLAIETDATLGRTTLRESLRLRPELLRRLGWHYLRVHSFELFSDPDAVARSIVTMLGADPNPVTEPIPVVAAH